MHPIVELKAESPHLPRSVFTLTVSHCHCCCWCNPMILTLNQQRRCYQRHHLGRIVCVELCPIFKLRIYNSRKCLANSWLPHTFPLQLWKFTLIKMVCYSVDCLPWGKKIVSKFATGRVCQPDESFKQKTNFCKAGRIRDCFWTAPKTRRKIHLSHRLGVGEILQTVTGVLLSIQVLPQMFLPLRQMETLYGYFYFTIQIVF